MKDEQDALAAVIQESAAPTVEVKEAAAASTVAAASTEKADLRQNYSLKDASRVGSILLFKKLLRF